MSTQARTTADLRVRKSNNSGKPMISKKIPHYIEPNASIDFSHKASNDPK